jgi:uncharacterized protein (DUF433 family)
MKLQHPVYEARIITDPEFLAGKPVIEGTRIPVALVLEYLANDPNFDAFFIDYPELTMAGVQTCLAYGQVLAPGETVRPAARRRGPHKALPHTR